MHKGGTPHTASPRASRTTHARHTTQKDVKSRVSLDERTDGATELQEMGHRTERAARNARRPQGSIGARGADKAAAQKRTEAMGHFPAVFSIYERGICQTILL